jgi:hypothetical protein
MSAEASGNKRAAAWRGAASNRELVFPVVPHSVRATGRCKKQAAPGNVTSVSHLHCASREINETEALRENGTLGSSREPPVFTVFSRTHAVRNNAKYRLTV